MAKKRHSLGVPSIDDSWMAQRDYDTLIEAEKIEKDPKRKAAVRKIALQRTEENAKVLSEVSGSSS